MRSTGDPSVNLRKCLGWHFELERHGNGLSESIELFSVCDGESGGTSRLYQLAEWFGLCDLVAEREGIYLR